MIPYGCKIFFTTLWHSGTHTTKVALEKNHGINFRHVDAEALKLASEAEVVITTFRDPYRIAASWCNRGKLEKSEWLRQWQFYKSILDFEPLIFFCDGPEVQHGIKLGKPLNQSPDTFSLHKALDESNFDYFYEHVPKSLIDYSLKCVSYSSQLQTAVKIYTNG